MSHTRSDAKARTDVLESLRAAAVELEEQITDTEDRAERNASVNTTKQRDLATRFSAMRNRQ